MSLPAFGRYLTITIAVLSFGGLAMLACFGGVVGEVDLDHRTLSMIGLCIVPYLALYFAAFSRCRAADDAETSLRQPEGLAYFALAGLNIIMLTPDSIASIANGSLADLGLTPVLFAALPIILILTVSKNMTLQSPAPDAESAA